MKQYQSDAINELATALAKAQAKMTHASRDAKNPHLKSKYADLSAVLDAARPQLAENGLCVVQITDLDESGAVNLVTQLNHISGQWMRSWYPVRPVKSDPQGFGSALTYARRYSYAAIVGVAATGEDDDGNAASGREARPAEYKGAFDSRDQLDAYVRNCVESLNNTTTAASVKDQRDLNKARWDAMKLSASPLDRDGYEAIVAAHNEAVKRLPKAEVPKPRTVDDAKGAALPPSVASDTIAY